MLEDPKQTTPDCNLFFKTLVIHKNDPALARVQHFTHRVNPDGDCSVVIVSVAELLVSRWTTENKLFAPGWAAEEDACS